MGVRESYKAPIRGILYEFPWEKWGNWKYLIFVGLGALALKENVPLRYNFSFHLLALSASRYLMFHFWCTLCRIPAIARKRQIQKKGMTFEQVDHEASWENMIFLSIIVLRIVQLFSFENNGTRLPLWNGKGIALAFLVHVGPVEWLYYWAHRALHHHYLYSRYHSHHHASFVTQPITSSNHPMLENLLYHGLFLIPVATTVLLGCFSVGVIYVYVLFIDLMNAWGHCNFEFVPPFLFKILPPLKYIIYSPSFHSLHHSKVHTNFCLFMPLYDYLYGTVDSTTDQLHHQSWIGDKSKVDCVYLSHMIDVHSMFHLPFGFQSFASQPYSKKWYTWLMLPIGLPIMVWSSLFAKPFVTSSHFIGKTFELQTWMIPRFKFQYNINGEKKKIRSWIESCALEAQDAKVGVLALGLLNKDVIDQTFFSKKIVSIPIVTGETLTTSLIVKQLIAKKINQVFLCSTNSRVGQAIMTYLCEYGVKVLALAPSNETFKSLSKNISVEFRKNLLCATTYADGKGYHVWIVGEELNKSKQLLASPRTHFYNFNVFPLTKHRHDCTYEPLPGLILPDHAKTINTCEDVMPRNVVRTSYVAGILHALEGWNHNDFLDEISSHRVEETWEATLKHGFMVYNKEP